MTVRRRTVVTALALVALAACATGDLAPSGPGHPRPSPSPSPWTPRQGTTWQWQLSDRLDLSVDAAVFDVDGDATSTAQVAALHARGRRVICYLSAGSWEAFRSDAGAFPAQVRGKALEGWPDERWLDIRSTDVLLPLMATRMDRCRAKGFDAVEADNVDGYANSTGFPLTSAHQLTYNRALARLAHERGMSIALKNDIEQIPALVSSFDFAINEECFAHDECEAYRPFLLAGKAVLNVEYAPEPEVCPHARRLGISSVHKQVELGAERHPC